MDPGELTEQITIEAQSSTRDAYGQLAETWAAIEGGTNVWAKIAPLAGREQMLAQSNKATLTHRITLYDDFTVTPRMRAKAGSRVWNIAAVRPLGTDGLFLELDAVEVV